MVRTVKADNPIEPGLAVLNSLFYQGRLIIDPALNSFIGEILSYHRDSKNPEKVADNQPDHAIDALRYCLNTLNNRSKGIVSTLK